MSINRGKNVCIIIHFSDFFFLFLFLLSHLPFIAFLLCLCVSLTREYSSHKNSLSSPSCPAGRIARREICMCHSFVSVCMAGNLVLCGMNSNKKGKKRRWERERTFQNQSTGDVRMPQDFFISSITHTGRSVKNFPLSLFFERRIATSLSSLFDRRE